MRCLVVYYSRTGNTEKVAQAVAARLVGRAPKATLHVGEKLARAGGFDDRIDAFTQELGQ